MNDNSMDVDSYIPPSENSPVVSHFSKDSPFPKLPTNQINAINSMMNMMSKSEDWPTHLESAGDDKKKWERLFNSVLLYFVVKVGSMDLEGFVPLSEIEQIVRNLNDHELDEGKQIVQRGVQGGGWKGLLTYRTLPGLPPEMIL